MSVKTFSVPFSTLAARNTIGIISLLSVCIYAGPAAAQGGGLLEEVIVTAQKREQSIQDVGISITSWSGDQIDQMGLESSVQIADITPGVFTAGNLGGQTTLFTIRGVVQNDFLDVTESPVAVYIDEGYIPMIQGQSFATFDVERVEILKGPQGTLFGRNATGGLVHFITRKPTREAEAFADITYASYDQVRFEGAVSGPLGESLSARVSGMYNKHDAIFDNHYPEGDPGASVYPFGNFGPGRAEPDDVWTDDSWAVRGQLLFEPNDDVEFLVSGFGAGTETSAGPTQSFPAVSILDAQGRFVNSIVSPPDNVCEAISAETGGCYMPGVEGLDGELQATSFDVGALVLSPLITGIPGVPFPFAGREDGLRPVPGGDYFGYIDADGDGFDTSHDISADDVNQFESHGVTAKLSWDFGNVNLTSVSNYMHFDKLVILDTDGAPVPQGIFGSVASEDTFSQELRLNGETERMRWVTGFYYLHIDNDNTAGLALPINSPLLGLTNTPDGSVIPGVYVPFLGTEANNEVRLKTNSYSLFGQVDYDLNDQFTFIAGIRGLVEKQSYDRSIIAYVNTDDYQVETDTRVAGSGIDFNGTLRTPFADSRSPTLWTGKVQLDYHPNENLLFYVGVNRGVKAGSYNAKVADGTPFLPDSEIPYGEEVLLSYEAGFKSTLFDGTTRFNASVYHYDYEDYQAFVFVRSSGFIVNNDATITGGEFDLQSSFGNGFDVIFSAHFQEAEVKNLEVAPAVFRDVKPAFAPETQLAGLARYTFPQDVFNGTLALQVNAQYNSTFFHNIRNFDAQKTRDFGVGNARINWTSADGRWDGTVFVNNFTDARIRLIGFDVSNLCGCVTYSYGKPRWVGASLRYNY